MRRTALFSSFALLLVIGISGAAADPRHPKLDHLLRDQLAAGTPSTNVIVRVRPTGSSRVIEKVKKARTLHHAPAVQTLATQVSAETLAALEADPDVLGVSADATVRASANPSHVSEVLGVDKRVWKALGLPKNDLNGEKVGVAIVDSGVTSSQDLMVRATVDFTDLSAAAAMDVKAAQERAKKHAGRDGYGHGTHVAGLIAGQGRGFHGLYRGLAPKVEVIDLRVLNDDGEGTTSAVVAAIEYAIANRDALHLDIINLSLGHPIYEPAETDPLVQAVERAVAAGIVVVASAGNMGRHPVTGEIGYAGISSPGNAPSAITVGALDTHDTLTRGDDSVAPYSSRGPTWYDGYAKPDVVAPGHHLVSSAAYGSRLFDQMHDRLLTDDGTIPQKDTDDPVYLSLSGTSMAAAVTTGVVALVIQANRSALPGDSPARLTPNAVKAILEYTATDLADTDPLTQGAGALNGLGAVQLAAVIDSSAAVGTWWLRSGVQPVSTFGQTFDPATKLLTGGETYEWSQRLVWGDRIVWGDSVYLNAPAWATGLVWGDRIVWSDHIGADQFLDADEIVRGDRIVWADRIVWGDNVVWDAEAVWGDRLVWGDRIVWGDRLVWGDTSELPYVVR